MRKNYSSNRKNYAIFRLCGMLAGIQGIRNEMTTKSDTQNVLTFAQNIHDAEYAIKNAVELLRKIDHTEIMR